MFYSLYIRIILVFAIISCTVAYSNSVIDESINYIPQSI